MTVIIIQPQATKAVPYSYPTRTNTHADTCATEQRIPLSIIVAIMLDREKKSLLFCTPTPSVDLLLLEC